MGSNIGWTDERWNPATGCSRVSPGCEHCYAEALSLRYGWSKKPWTARNAAENVVLHHDRLEAPLHWRKPRMVFVNSMSDLFHELIPDDFLDLVFAVMALAPEHTFQVLTKRPDRMQAYCSQRYLPGRLNDAWIKHRDVDPQIRGWPLSNVWLGVSVEDQRRVDERIPLLLKSPAAVRFLSVEPLLGPVSFRWADWVPMRGGWHLDGLRGVDWVIIGGESGPNYRPMHVEWVESIVEQCRDANVPVFVKQDAGSRPGKQGRIPNELWALKQYPKVAV